MAPNHRTDGGTLGNIEACSRIAVFLHDPIERRRSAVKRWMCATDPAIHLSSTLPTRFDDGDTGGFVWSFAVVGTDLGTESWPLRIPDEVLTLVQRLALRSIPVVAYANGAQSWPISQRCRMLLAGSSSLLDSSRADFETQVVELLRKRVQASTAAHTADERLKSMTTRLGIVGGSRALSAALHAVERSARLSDMPVLLLGESGSGKELLARAVHALDPQRNNHPFVPVNCATLTKTLAEAELFGHRRGAFSGAERERPGFVRAADGGVLFLDEIADLDLDLQGKLLRTLQERSVLVLGDTHETHVDVRIVAATHRDLHAMSAQQRFRADLLHRLWVYPIEAPPLRRRREDIPALVSSFVAKHSEPRAPPPTVTPEFLTALQFAELPGNVRQLENIVRRALAMTDPERPLDLAALPREIWAELVSERDGDARHTHAVGQAAAGDPNLDLNLARSVARHERNLVVTALRMSEGNQTRAASLLGITTRSIYNKLRKHRLVERQPR